MKMAIKFHRNLGFNLGVKMSSEIIVALLSLAGTMLGTFGGIVTASKLTNYRLQQLEKKVDKHNNFAERIPVLETKIKDIYYDLDELKKGGNR